MNQTLTLNRRMRPNIVLPTILRVLQDRLIFWRREPIARWDWIALLCFAALMWFFYREFTGNSGFLPGFLLALIANDLHNDALPIFARLRIKGNKIAIGTIFPARHSLAEIVSYQTSREDLPDYLVRFNLSEKYWPHRVSFVIDAEGAATLSEYLEARDIAAVAAVAAPVALPV